MSRRRFRSAVAGCCALAFDLGAITLHADTSECNGAYVETQQLRRSGKLKSARLAALACAQDTCSVTVRRNCSEWLEDITKATPSIVIEARDGAGNELVAVRVLVDDVLLAERLDGQALPLDPGAHELRFEHHGEVRTQRLVALEGQAYRRVSVHFEPAPGGGASSAWLATSAPTGALPASSPAAASAARAIGVVGATSAGPYPSLEAAAKGPTPEPSRTTPPPDSSLFARPIPTSTYVLGGVGVASLSTFAVLATSAYMSEQDLRSECGRRCSESRVEPIRDRYVIADIALGVGITSLVAAGALWVLVPSAHTSSSTKPELQLGWHASSVSVSGSF